MKNKKRKNILKEEYSKTFLYLRSLKNFIWIIVGIFVLFFLIGLFVPIPLEISDSIFKYLTELLSKTKNFSSYSQWFSFIFINNLISSFSSSFGGIILGIYPILSSIINGFLLGFVSKLSIFEEGIFSLWKLLPHGIFELPAIFISFASGLKLGSFIFEKQKIHFLLFFLKNTLRIFIFIVLPLLFFAALIESALIFFG